MFQESDQISDSVKEKLSIRFRRDRKFDRRTLNVDVANRHVKFFIINETIFYTELIVTSQSIKH